MFSGLLNGRERQRGLPLLPPGTILQRLYLKERLSRFQPGTFVEVGTGRGLLSKLLLDLGWCGVGYDLNEVALRSAAELNAKSIGEERYSLYNEDWLTAAPRETVDLVVSSMVLEHLDDRGERQYFENCARFLKDSGTGIVMVPGSPAHWGIEDIIAGHYRRYSLETLAGSLQEFGWAPEHLAGLTYPLSNLLLPVSNCLVRKLEDYKRRLPIAERTELSGARHVRWKTDFPQWAGLLLNELTLYPFHILQKLNRKNKSSLVIYAEFRQLNPSRKRSTSTRS